MQRINHLSFSVLTCLLTCLLASCAGSQANDSSAQASSLKAASAFDTPPQATMSGVMQSKLVHAQALLDGLVVSDYTKIEGPVRQENVREVFRKVRGARCVYDKKLESA